MTFVYRYTPNIYTYFKSIDKILIVSLTISVLVLPVPKDKNLFSRRTPHTPACLTDGLGWGGGSVVSPLITYQIHQGATASGASSRGGALCLKQRGFNEQHQCKSEARQTAAHTESFHRALP